MPKRHETMKEGLEREANKKGLTGKERHRYIGGALTNMEKRGKITVHRKPPPRKEKKPREKLVLTVKKNSAISKARGYPVYSLYRADGKQFNDSTFRKRSSAYAAANDEMHAYNQGFLQKRIKG